MRAIFATVLFLTATSASAATWVEASQSSSGSVVYVDVDSIRDVAGKRQIWVQIDQSNNPSVKARTSKELWRYDCPSQTSITLSWIDYDSSGRVMKSGGNIDNPYLYQPVVPDSTGETIMKIACNPKNASNS